jgi:hypothetical protein
MCEELNNDLFELGGLTFKTFLDCRRYVCPHLEPPQPLFATPPNLSHTLCINDCDSGWHFGLPAEHQLPDRSLNCIPILLLVNELIEPAAGPEEPHYIHPLTGNSLILLADFKKTLYVSDYFGKVVDSALLALYRLHFECLVFY